MIKTARKRIKTPDWILKGGEKTNDKLRNRKKRLGRSKKSLRDEFETGSDIGTAVLDPFGFMYSTFGGLP